MGDQGVMKRGELVGLVLYPVRRSGVAFQARFFRVRAFPRVEGQPKGYSGKKQGHCSKLQGGTGSCPLAYAPSMLSSVPPSFSVQPGAMVYHLSQLTVCPAFSPLLLFPGLCMCVSVCKSVSRPTHT